MGTMRESRLPIPGKIIVAFYFMFGAFFFFSGIVFSNVLLYFFSIMTMSPAPLSDEIVLNWNLISSRLSFDFDPIIYALYKENIAQLGILTLLQGIIVILVCIGFCKRMNWARYLLAIISFFEFFVVGGSYFFEGGFLAASVHWLLYGVILYFLLLNKKLISSFK